MPGKTSRYTFTDYSLAWPLEFEREASRLRAMVGDELVEVHHIGSTSVPGLAAKPIIDLLPKVRRIAHLDDCRQKFVEAGYEAWGEYGIAGRRFFTKDHDGSRTHNVHFFETGNPEIERHLAFAAYLRAHPAVRDEYAAVKREAYASHPADINAYNDAKNEWIKRIERIAVGWSRGQA